MKRTISSRFFIAAVVVIPSAGSANPLIEGDAHWSSRIIGLN